MNEIKLTFIILLILSSIVFGNRIVAKGWSPGELFIVGPDVSVDSTSYTILYYSLDNGSTLVVRDTLDWCGVISGVHFAADITPDVLYLNTCLLGIFASWDGGRTWEHRFSHIGIECEDIRAGVRIGEAIIAGWTTNDFGNSWVGRSGDGIFGSEFNFWEVNNPNLYFIENSDGILFASEDTFNSGVEVYDFGMSTSIFRGSIEEQLYTHSEMSILLSLDAGANFDTVGSMASLIPDSFAFELISGWEEGELFCVTTKYNIVEMIGVFGGTIIVWHSNDYGMTWNLIEWHEANIQEFQDSQNIDIEIFPNPFHEIVETNIPVKIYDISGRQIANGTGRIDLSETKPGVYFAIANIDGQVFSKKILKIQ